MATIAFMPPSEKAGALFFPHPRRLTAWTDPEPEYDRIYVVKIDDANPARFRVAVRSIPVAGINARTQLGTTHLDDADDLSRHVPTANSGRNLDLKFESKKNALVIFHLTDPNARFVENVADSVVKNADEPGADMFYHAEWVSGHDHKAVSVIMVGGPSGPTKRDYGLGVRLKNDDPHGPGYTTIIIDPKVENEGHN